MNTSRSTDPPALPWAHHEGPKPQAGASSADGACVQTEQGNGPAFIDLQQAGLAVGDKIQVKWMLEPEDEAEEGHAEWWTGTITGPSTTQDPSNPSAPVLDLVYEAKEGFEEETCCIVLTSEHTLRDLDQEDDLVWRRHGDTWDVSEDEEGEAEDPLQACVSAIVNGEHAEDEEDVDENGERRLFSLQDVAQRMQASAECQAMDRAADEELAKLQPAQQIALASGFRHFADSFVAFLAKKTEAGSNVVEVEDVQEFMRDMGIPPLSKRQRTT